MKKKKDVITIDKDKLKNGIIIVLILIIVFGASFMATKVGDDSNKKDQADTTMNDTTTIDTSSKAQEESASIKEEEQKELESINVERYLELKEKSNPSIIYIARPTCHYCEIQGPIIKNIAYEKDLTIYYLNTDEMSAEDSSKLIKSDDTFKDGFGTPCTIVVGEDKILGKSEGLTDKETMIEFFKSNKMISE